MGRRGRKCLRVFAPHLYLAYRFTSRADAAEDLTQEVFVRVYRSLDQYDPKQGDLQNWLMRLARNLIIDDYRRASARRTTRRPKIWKFTHTISAPPGVAAAGDGAPRAGRAGAAGIDKLPPDLRTCVILRDIEELSYQEIVDLLKIPEGTVKSASTGAHRVGEDSAPDARRRDERGIKLAVLDFQLPIKLPSNRKLAIENRKLSGGVEQEFKCFVLTSRIA